MVTKILVCSILAALIASGFVRFPLPRIVRPRFPHLTNETHGGIAAVVAGAVIGLSWWGCFFIPRLDAVVILGLTTLPTLYVVVFDVLIRRNHRHPLLDAFAQYEKSQHAPTHTEITSLLDASRSLSPATSDDVLLAQSKDMEKLLRRLQLSVIEPGKLDIASYLQHLEGEVYTYVLQKEGVTLDTQQMPLTGDPEVDTALRLSLSRRALRNLPTLLVKQRLDDMSALTESLHTLGERTRTFEDFTHDWKKRVEQDTSHQSDPVSAALSRLQGLENGSAKERLNEVRQLLDTFVTDGLMTEEAAETYYENTIDDMLNHFGSRGA